MKVKGLDHIGVAVHNLQDALVFYRDTLGLQLESVEVVEEQGVRVAVLPVGDTHLELLEATNREGHIARFLSSHGEGIHHICLEVDDIEVALSSLDAKGIRLIDRAPRIGAGGKKIAFLNPRSTFGVLIELGEKARR